jgi:hypothetical protein
MRHRAFRVESLVWPALAFAGGAFVGMLDTRSSDVQGPALLLMVTCFGLTLPGRANALAVAVATVAGMLASSTAITRELNAGMLVALVPATIASFGGRLFGRFLDRAAAHLVPIVVDESEPWYRRSLSTRFLLATSLVAIAWASERAVRDALTLQGHPAARWLAMVWQIMTLLGWILMTPVVLHERLFPFSRDRARGSGPALVDLAGHALFILLLANIHAAVIVTLCGMLWIPLTPNWPGLTRAAIGVYLPLDALAYVTILALGYASDMERHRREAAQREEALRAESLDNRLKALRARLNPHFLFNALNSVSVLARGGRPAETSRVIDGLTGLLRYVLDERRAMVPLTEELAFVRDYLEIQQVRFSDRLRFDVTENGVGKAVVPQLVLQPIVENAVEHGVGDSIDGGMVTVGARREGETLLLVVEDEGSGASSPEGNGIGLSSTRERLSRLFGDRASLQVEPRAVRARGTRVTIRLPFEELAQPA